jgi:hypothetical protein
VTVSRSLLLPTRRGNAVCPAAVRRRSVTAARRWVVPRRPRDGAVRRPHEGRAAAYRRAVRTRHPDARRRQAARRRPTPLQWVRYAFGGGLPAELSPWVLADTTERGWVRRHLARAVVQLLPVLVLCLVVVPVPLTYRLSAAAGGLLMGLIFSVAFMTETTEHRVAKAGYPAGTAARLREERAERERLDRHSPYRQGGAGSFD